jgi:hypothetical protein
MKLPSTFSAAEKTMTTGEQTQGVTQSAQIADWEETSSCAPDLDRGELGCQTCRRE